MKLFLKILAAPVIAALALTVWLCSKLLCCAAYILGFMGTVLAILALLVLFTTSVQNGIILLVIAFLISPLGLPMAAAWLLGRVQALRYFIQDAVF